MRRGQRPATVGERLTRAYAALLALLVVVGASGVAALVVAERGVARSDRLDRVYEANLVALQALTDAETGSRGYRLARDRDFLEPYASGTRTFPAQLAIARAASSQEPVLLAALDAEERAAEDWLDAIGRPVAAMGPDEARLGQVDVVRGRALFDAFRAANAEVRAIVDLERQRAAAERSRLQRALVLVVSVLLVLAVAAATASALRLRHALVDPLAAVRAATARLGAGERHARAPEDTGPLEVRELAHALNALAAGDERTRRERAEQERLRRVAVEVGRRVRTSLDLDEVLLAAVEAAGAGLDCDRSFIRVADTEGRIGGIGVQWYAEGLAPIVEDEELRVQGPWGWSADLRSGREAFVCGDAAGDRRLQSEEGLRWLLLTSARSFLAVPVAAGGEVVGVLTLLRTTRASEWSPAEVAAAHSIAADLARALQHAGVFAQQLAVVDRLRELDQVKTDFLSTVSHELRTPLTSISGYVELLRDEDAGPVTPEMDRMLDVVDRNTWRLKSLIEDLLTLSRIESGAFRLTTARVDLPELVEGAVAAIAPCATGAGIDLGVELEPGVVVTGDAGQLERVLLNALSNAVKFTPAGGSARVGVTVEDGAAVVRVSDTGIGIPAAEQDRLFGRFFRASNAQTAAIQGTGLGLAIVRSVVEHHGGTVALHSAEGAGTTLTVRLPLAGGRPLGGAEAPAEPLAAAGIPTSRGGLSPEPAGALVPAP